MVYRFYLERCNFAEIDEPNLNTVYLSVNDLNFLDRVEWNAR